MATNTITLPEGFELDVKPVPPEGFELDATFSPVNDFNAIQSEDKAAKIYDTAIESGITTNESKDLYKNLSPFDSSGVGMGMSLSLSNVEQIKQQGLVKRFGKQLYNKSIADVLHTLGKSDYSAVQSRAYVKMFQWEKETGIKLNDTFFQEQLDDWSYQLTLPPTQRESEFLKSEPQFNPPKPDVNPFAAEVSQAEGASDKVIDALAGIIGFVAQASLLEKYAPSIPKPAVWETVSMANGEPPGIGIAMHGIMSGTGKLFPGADWLSATKRAVTTGTIFGATTAAGGGDTTDILIASGIPSAFEGLNLGKQAWRNYKGKENFINIMRKKEPNLSNKSYEEIDRAMEKVLPQEKSAEATTMAEKPSGIAQVSKSTEKAGVAGIELDIKSLTDKALVELAKAEKPRAQIETEKTTELGKRAAIGERAVGTAKGEQRLEAALSSLKGPLTEYKNPDFKPLRETMPKEALSTLHDDIWLKPHTDEFFTKLNTAKAWAKVVEGFVPTRGEILLLEKQWGKDFAKGLLKKLPLGDKIWDTVADISNFMRTMVAGGDVSAVGRQLRLLGQIYPQEYGRAIKEGAKAYASENLANDVRKEYESSPYHKEAKRFIKFFEKAGTVSVEPSERPEWYISHYPEKIPILGHLIRMGNRSYVEATNVITQAIWDKLRLQDNINGITPTKEQLAARGKWMMSMEGRPEIGGVIGRRVAPITAGFFFAPRYAISRFTTPLYLKNLVSGDPVARQIGKQTAGAFATMIGTNIAIITLAKLALGDKASVELDSRSADWGKLKINNKHIDLWNGYQQAARFMVQVALGEYKTQAGKIKERPRTEIIGRFIRSKENPLVALIADLWAGKTFQGDRPFSPPKGEMKKKLDELGIPDIVQGVGKEAYNRMLFMWVQDFTDASINDGWVSGLSTGALSFIGIGASSYQDTAYTKIIQFQDKIAQQEYGKEWSELNDIEQRRLTRAKKNELAQMELATKVEGVNAFDFDYVSRIITEQKEAGRNIYNQLPKEQQGLLDEMGISLGLARRIGQWEISDEKYAEYQNAMASILKDKLGRLIDRGTWNELSIQNRTHKLEIAIENARTKASLRIKREARQN